MSNVEEPIIEEEEKEEEEEEHYEDNTGQRDEILQSQPKNYDEWIAYINNLQIKVPEIPDIDFTDEEEIFAHIPIIIDACKYIYNTRNYRFESYAKASNDLYTTYKKDFENIGTKYSELLSSTNSKYSEKINEINEDTLLTPEEKEEEIQKIEEEKEGEISKIDSDKENEVLALNTDYMNKCYAIVQKVNDVKQQTVTETGFIGDVYIEGKLNNHPVSEYVLRSELTTGDDGNISIDLEGYVKEEELEDYVKKDSINEYIKQFEFYYIQMDEKLSLKLDKSTFGFSDDNTLINKFLQYNHKCDSLETQSNSIAVKLLPLVNDDQMYFLFGYLYIRNYWNSEVIYKIEAKAKNSEVEVNQVDIIRSNGTHWTPLEGLHKITFNEKAYGGVIINSEDSYNWKVYFSGYYNDIEICKIVKEGEYTDESTFSLTNISTVKEDLDNKLTENVESLNSNLENAKSELNEKITSEVNTLNESLTDVKEEINNKIITDIDDINEKLDSKADIGHTHEAKSFQLQNVDGTKNLNVNSDFITMSNNTNSTIKS